MKKLILASFFVATLASASTDSSFWPRATMGHNEAERCVTNDDPFDVPAYVYATQSPFKEGVYAFSFPNTETPLDLGRCVDRSHYRPVLTLSKEGQEAYGQWEDSEHVVVANVRHLEKFYVARIPVTKISHMNFMETVTKMAVLGVRGGHAEMRVFFSEPVRLVPQWPYGEGQDLYVRELIFTGNPTGVNSGDRTDTVKNFDGSLLHARGIHTLETRLKDSFVDSSAITEHQFRMKMNAKESEDYVRYYIRLADTQRLGRQFLLTSLNCNFTQFEVLDKVLSHRYKAVRIPFDPEYALKNLRMRKIIDETIVLPEFQLEEGNSKIINAFKKASASQN
jgi:hypothetical protein